MTSFSSFSPPLPSPSSPSSYQVHQQIPRTPAIIPPPVGGFRRNVTSRTCTISTVLLATVACIVALSLCLCLFAGLGGCTPDLELNHDRRSLSSTSPNRNVEHLDLFCREDGSETLATFWNSDTHLNLIASVTHTHVDTHDTVAAIVCRNEEGVSEEKNLAGLLLAAASPVYSICLLWCQSSCWMYL